MVGNAISASGVMVKWFALLLNRVQNLNKIRDQSAVKVHHNKESTETFD